MTDTTPNQKAKPKETEEDEDSLEKFIEELVDFSIENPDIAGYDDPKDRARFLRLIKNEKAKRHEKTKTS